MDKQGSYARARERLEEIVAQVRAKDISLEKSLDLYEEALRLGSTCAEMIDRTDFSAEELEAVTRAGDVEGTGDAGDAEGVEGAGGAEGADAEDSGDVDDADTDTAAASTDPAGER